MRSAETIALVSGGLTIWRDAMFDLSDDEIDALLSAGRLRLRDEHRVRDPWEETREKIAEGALCLALRDSWTHRAPPLRRSYTALQKGGLLDNASMGGFDDPEGHAHNMWLTRLERETFSRRLVDERSVGELLREIASSRAESIHGRDGGVFEIGDDVQPEALEAVRTEGNYSGAWKICSCGEWADGSSFLWMADRRPLLLVDADCGEVCRVELLPGGGKGVGGRGEPRRRG